MQFIQCFCYFLYSNSLFKTLLQSVHIALSHHRRHKLSAAVIISLRRYSYPRGLACKKKSVQKNNRKSHSAEIEPDPFLYT